MIAIFPLLQNQEIGTYYPPLPRDGAASDLLANNFDSALDPSIADAHSSDEDEDEEEEMEPSVSKASRKRDWSEDLGEEVTSKNSSSSHEATEELDQEAAHHAIPLRTLLLCP